MGHVIRNFFLGITPPYLTRIYYQFRNRNSNPPMDLFQLSALSKYLPRSLVIEVEQFLNSEDYLYTSKYWRHLMLRHLEHISNTGIEKWGTNIALNYFTWTKLEDLKLKNLSSCKTQEVNFLKLHDGLTASESYSYNLICNLLWRHLCNLDNFPINLIKTSAEQYNFGNSPHIEIDGLFLTQDLLNSAIEFWTYEKALTREKSRILEIGAGSGRSAQFLLQAGLVDKYVIIDIPPASFIAKERIKRGFPDLRVVSCTDSEILQEFVANGEYDVLFLIPSIAKYLPRKYFDICLAIDCLHEMTKQTRIFYSKLAENTSNNFYSKTWKQAYIPVDKEYLDADNFESYGFQVNWECIATSDCVFPADFYEYLFKFS